MWAKNPHLYYDGGVSIECNMTRPMTGQPATDEELTNAVQEANKTMNDDVPEDIKNHPLTKDSLKDDDTDEKSDDEKLEELREFRKTAREQGNDKIGAYGEPQTDDDTEMVVTDGDGEQTFTRDEWEAERSARTRVWDRLERNGGMFVRVAHWFNDSDVNKVKSGRGFFGHKVGETDKALKFEVSADDGNHNATVETVWVPKKAVRTHELK